MGGDSMSVRLVVMNGENGHQAVVNPIHSLVNAFLNRENSHTRGAYRLHLTGFGQFLNSSTLYEAVEGFLIQSSSEAYATVQIYRNHLIQKGLSVATVNAKLSVLRLLLQTAKQLRLITWTLKIDYLKALPYRDTRGPGAEGVKALFERLKDQPDKKSLRDYAILHLLHDLALRRAEVVALDLEDVQLDALQIAILGKGHLEKQRLTLPHQTADILRAWIQIRGSEPGPLFINFDRAGKGHRLTAGSIYCIVRDLGQVVGIRVRPHGLRHAAITTALDLTNGNIRAVQRFARLKDVRVVEVYDDGRKNLAGEVAEKIAASNT